jgi:hypothetical protein
MRTETLLVCDLHFADIFKSIHLTAMFVCMMHECLTEQATENGDWAALVDSYLQERSC